MQRRRRPTTHVDRSLPLADGLAAAFDSMRSMQVGIGAEDKVTDTPPSLRTFANQSEAKSGPTNERPAKEARDTCQADAARRRTSRSLIRLEQ